MYKNYEEKNSIELLCNEIRKALNNDMYFAALIMSLSIPDTFAKLEYGCTGQKHYVKWFDEYYRESIGVTINEKKLS